MGGEGTRFVLLSRETDSLELRREQGGVTGALGSTDPGAWGQGSCATHTPRKGGHVGTPSLPRSLALGQLPFPFLRYWCVSWVSSPRAAAGNLLLFLGRSLALRVPALPPDPGRARSARRSLLGPGLRP